MVIKHEKAPMHNACDMHLSFSLMLSHILLQKIIEKKSFLVNELKDELQT